MDLTQRQKIIFKTIVERFTYCAEPIGSKTLQELLDFPISSATIRNEMAVLEKAGLLEKTHTSSGRIPSAQGYRYYVENLMETELPDNVHDSLQEVFASRNYTQDEVVDLACKILSEMTNLTSIVLGPDSSHQTLAHIQLVPVSPDSAVAIIVTSTGHTENKLFQFREDVSVADLRACTDLFNDSLVGTPIDHIVDKMKELEPVMAARLTRHEVLFEAFVCAFMKFAAEKVAVSGRSNMLAQPEFSDVNRLRKLMRILENSDLFKAWTGQESNIAVPIDSRNELIQIGDCSVVTAKFHYRNNEEGQLMVVGPNRMQYSKVVALTDYLSNVIEEVFSEEEGDAGSEQEDKESTGSSPPKR
jgi:heat-inducible transcriptional repressor